MTFHKNKIINAIAYILTILIVIVLIVVFSIMDFAGNIFTLLFIVPALIIGFVVYAIVKITYATISTMINKI